MVQLDTLSKACQERQVTIVTLSQCYKSVTIDLAYFITPMCTIVEPPSLEDGSSKELRSLNNILAQHLQALKVMEYEPSPFITSLIEMKLDQATAFRWQRHIQGTSKVPHYSELLKFLDLQARASESTTREGVKRSAQSMPHKANVQLKPVYLSNTINSCTVCGGKMHPLYACRKFRSLSYDQHMEAVKSNQLCFNCLKLGDHKLQCPWLHRCQVCQRLYHTLLHLDENEDVLTNARRRSPLRSGSPPAATSNPLTLSSHVANN